jgi:hypothetical protein
MAKPRITSEEVVVKYFQTESLEKVQVLFNIVKGMLKTRLEGTSNTKAAVKVTKTAKAPANRVQPTVTVNDEEDDGFDQALSKLR